MPQKPKKQKRRDEAELRRFEPVSDDTVLAAVDRARRHDPHQHHRERAGAPLSEISEHLGFVATGWTSRQLRPQLDALVAAGVLAVSRRDRRFRWSPTTTGRERLASLRRSRKVPTLPESPQHREWRRARAAAAEHIGELGAQLRHDLDEAGVLLNRYRHVPSDAWFALGGRLSRASTLLGTATHCLYEWEEPDDAEADIDSGEDPGDERLVKSERDRRRWLRGGRRNLLRNLREDEDAFGRLAEPIPPELITVPAELVADLRDGLHNELTVPTGDIVDLVALADRKRRREEYHAHLEYFDELRDLVDLVGWASPRQRAAVVLDLRRYRRAVTAALGFAVQASEDELERAATAEPSRRQATARHVSTLREFASSVAEIATRIESQEQPERKGSR